MSVIVTLNFEGDPAQMEAQAAAEPDRIRAIVDQAKEHGLIAHRFYGSDGRILVVDEWPDEQSFQAFFAGQPEIADVLRDGGAQGPPETSVYRKLSTPDQF